MVEETFGGYTTLFTTRSNPRNVEADVTPVEDLTVGPQRVSKVISGKNSVVNEPLGEYTTLFTTGKNPRMVEADVIPCSRRRGRELK